MEPKYIWMRPVLGMATTAGVLFLAVYICRKIFLLGIDSVPGEMLVLFGALVQTIILMAKDSNGFYYGTSQGSANKSVTIDSIINGEDK